MSPAEYIALALLGEAALSIAPGTPVAEPYTGADVNKAADEVWQEVTDTPAPKGWVERAYHGCYRLWGETW